jgi:hypothetical protein
MKTISLQPARILLAALVFGIFLLSTCTPALAQQEVIANKDVTRPELQQQLAEPAFISQAKAENRNGYHEISWSSRNDQDVQKFYVEYTTDGTHYQSAGEVSLQATGNYLFQHRITDSGSMLYRVAMLLKNNRRAHSASFFLQGSDPAPVRFYPTVISGNTMNIRAEWPLQKISIVSTAGQQVFEKNLGGQLHDIPVVLPGLSKGIYIVTFYGNGWKHSEKMVIS